MNPLNEMTSRVIHTGTVIGIAILTVGLLLSGTDYGSDIMLAGVVILVLTPMAGILTATVYLFKEGDRRWGRVAVILITVIVVGLLISLLT